MENAGMSLMTKIGIGFSAIVFGLAVFHIPIESVEGDKALVARIMHNGTVASIIHALEGVLHDYIKPDALDATIKGLQDGTEVTDILKKNLPTTFDASSILKLIPTDTIIENMLK